ncbi:hypothetical protein GGTG_11675 [Gaeumannomyces tritici R3-111a-1]|uniref:Uncharacterized protein n=1 Tax=Gaeumannomyces tritici (strain R3-111a-1) TaxID=644352 RepID=J3PDV2_GAET3|nr:hypothetical protein GGTG_11675 [Gaeumannomyces tritici R3-111a-1]EJT70652.1 hypothetical protein GGTG_11675 [Gaeumannomyces tritici R3-111a-1]
MSLCAQPGPGKHPQSVAAASLLRQADGSHYTDRPLASPMIDDMNAQSRGVDGRTHHSCHAADHLSDLMNCCRGSVGSGNRSALGAVARERVSSPSQLRAGAMAAPARVLPRPFLPGGLATVGSLLSPSGTRAVATSHGSQTWPSLEFSKRVSHMGVAKRGQPTDRLGYLSRLAEPSKTVAQHARARHPGLPEGPDE